MAAGLTHAASSMPEVQPSPVPPHASADRNGWRLRTHVLPIQRRHLWPPRRNLDAAQAARAEADVARADAEAARDAAREARDDARDALSRAEARIAALADQRVRLEARADELATALAEADDDATLDAAVASAARIAEDADRQREAAETAFEAAETARRDAETVWSDARLAHAQTATEVASRQAALDRNAHAQRELATRREARETETDRLNAELDAAAGSEGDLQTRLDAEREKTDALKTTTAETETAVLQGRAHIADVEAALREVRSAREAAVQATTAAELRLVEIGTRQDTILERLADEHGVDLDEADEERERLQTEEMFQPDTARLEVPRLRDKIRSLGAVNALALESYEEEQTRLAFLQEQRTDLAEAEASLLDTIREINETARVRFGETFEAVREAFQKLFTDLFGETATADLALDGEDPLEAPVTISARPHGKRPVSLAQLSGGEKTLTATALLFAIYLVKPSPFCILDEVDAPLDDANVGRFMNLIRSFADSNPVHSRHAQQADHGSSRPDVRRYDANARDQSSCRRSVRPCQWRWCGYRTTGTCIPTGRGPYGYGMIRIPFKFDLNDGFISLSGTVSLQGEDLVIETSKAILDMIPYGKETFRIPAEEIETIELVKNRLIIRPFSFEFLDGFPGDPVEEISIKIARKHRDNADVLARETRLRNLPALGETLGIGRRDPGQ